MNDQKRKQAQAALFEALCTVAPELNPQDIAPDAPLREQVDIDSFDFLNVIIRLKELLGVEVPERDYAEFGTLERAVSYLARCGADSSQGD